MKIFLKKEFLQNHNKETKDLMKKQLLIIIITLILIIIGFNGCIDNNSRETNNKFFGVWETLTDIEGDRFYHIITFYSNGTEKLYHKTSSAGFTDSGTWYNNKTIVSFNYSVLDHFYTRDFQYTFTNNTTLILQDNSSAIIYKKITEG